MLDKKIVNLSILYTIARYFVLLLGFIRTTFIAISLSKYDMGELVIIYLITEYAAYLFSLGLPNSINLQTSIDKNSFKNINITSQIIKKYYSIFFLILFVAASIFYMSLYFLSNFYSEHLKEIITNNYNSIFVVILLYSIRAFFNMSNRLWERGFNLLCADIISAIVLFVGIFFVINKYTENVIGLMLYVMMISQITAIIISNIKLSSKHILSFDSKTLKKLLPLGVLLMLQNLMELYFWGIDRLFISFYLNLADLASFHIAHTYGRGLMIFFAALTFLIYPRLITILSSEKTTNKDILRIISKSFLVSEVILVLVFNFYIIIIPNIMNSLLKKYDDFYYIFSFILLGLIIKSLTYFPVTLLIARKRQKKLILNSFIFLLILIFLYNSFYNAEIIKGSEGFTIIAVIIFLCFSMLIYSWSMYVLNTKKVYSEVFKKFWKIITLFCAVFLCYYYDVVQFNSNIIIASTTLMIYYKNFYDQFKIIKFTVLALYKKKIK